MSFTRFLFVSFSAFLLSIMTHVVPLPVNITQAYPNTKSEPITQLAVAQNQQQSRNWSGYAASNGTFTGIQATWTVNPNNTAGNYGIDATWVGIGGVNTNDLIQAGTQQTIDRNGEISYEAFYEKLPDISQPVDLTIQPGNSITASVTQLRNNEWEIQIKNNTTGQVAKIQTSYASTLSSAEWIEEAPSGMRRILPLDNFGTIAFQHASVVENGQQLTISQVDAQPISMSNDFGQTLAQASVLSNSGTSFTVTRTKTPAMMTSDTSDVETNVVQKIGQDVPYVIHRITFYLR